MTETIEKLRLCSLRGCKQPHYSRGLCGSHSYRERTYGTPYGSTISPSQRFGLNAERKVACLLRRYGRNVVRQKRNAAFDLLVDGHLRVEVKAAHPNVYRGAMQWVFNINAANHGNRKGKDVTDCYVFRLERVPFCKSAVHLMVPAPITQEIVLITFRSLLNQDARSQAFYSLAKGKSI